MTGQPSHHRIEQMIRDAAMMAVLAGRRTGLKEYQRETLAKVA